MICALSEEIYAKLSFKLNNLNIAEIRFFAIFFHKMKNVPSKQKTRVLNLLFL